MRFLADVTHLFLVQTNGLFCLMVSVLCETMSLKYVTFWQPLTIVIREEIYLVEDGKKKKKKEGREEGVRETIYCR